MLYSRTKTFPYHIMKKILILLSALFFQFLATAQEHGKEIQEEYEREGWSNETKWVMVGIFAFVILILVLRTFRNKADV